MLQDRAFAKLERVLFWGLLLGSLLPIWRWQYFLTIDGPAHLYNAWVLKTMLLQPHSRFHEWLAFNFNPEPNYLSHLLLGGLLPVLPPWLAEKVVQTLYVLGLPLALRYLLRNWQPAAGFLAVLGFPLVYCVVFVFGFYNFCLSVVGLLLVLGYWRRHLLPPLPARPAAIAKLAALLTLLYLAHPLSYLVSGLVLGLLLTELALRRQFGTWAAAGRAVVALALAYLPTLPLLGWYLWSKGTATDQPPASHRDNLVEWLKLSPLRHMTAPEGSTAHLGANLRSLWLLASTEATYLRLLSLLVLVALGYAAWHYLRRQAAAPMLAWWVAAGLLLLAFVYLPDAIAGGSVIRPRWGLLSYLLVLVGLGTVRYGPRWRLGVLLAGTGLTVALGAFRYGRYQALQSALAEYRAAGTRLQAATSLLPLIYAQPVRMPDGSSYPSSYNMLSHAASYTSLERNLLDFENYEAETDYFPLRWRPGQVPLCQPNDTPAQPTQALLAHPARYVLLWGSQQPSPTGSAANRRLIGEWLRRRYRLHYRSPSGLLAVYELRPLVAAAPLDAAAAR